MRKLISSTVIWLLFVVVAGTVPQSPDSLVDSRPQFPPSAAKVHGRHVPKLSTLRSSETLPVPGGLGAGTVYRQGSLRVTSKAELSTQMVVHPNGIAVPEFLFTTATNRTELTIEVVGIYIGTGAALGVFDWSCLPDYPCPNGSIEASWQWTKDLTEMSCYYAVGDDGGGHPHNLLSYVNRSHRRGNGTAPPAPVPNWTNSVLLLNHCTNKWDLVYSHEFRATQKDCSADNSCGWWGPILETFNADPQPLINELGFVGTTLRYDNTVSALEPGETGFVSPNAPWFLFHAVPNGSWGIGSFPGD